MIWRSVHTRANIASCGKDIQELSVRRLSNQRAKLTQELLRLKSMLYMVIEYFNAGAAVDIYRRARDRGRQLPLGLEYVDSWVDLNYFRCFQLMRTDDRALFERIFTI